MKKRKKPALKIYPTGLSALPLTDAMLADIRRNADALGVSMNEFIRSAIAHALDERRSHAEATGETA